MDDKVNHHPPRSTVEKLMRERAEEAEKLVRERVDELFDKELNSRSDRIHGMVQGYVDALPEGWEENRELGQRCAASPLTPDQRKVLEGMLVSYPCSKCNTRSKEVGKWWDWSVCPGVLRVCDYCEGSGVSPSSIERTDALTAALYAPPTAAQRFVNFAIEVSRDGGWDGADLQDDLVKYGLLKKVERTEPCGEVCACREAEAVFPTECYVATTEDVPGFTVDELGFMREMAVCGMPARNGKSYDECAAVLHKLDAMIAGVEKAMPEMPASYKD